MKTKKQVNSDLDSNEELYFQWWLEEMQEKGFIDSFKREPISFMLADGVDIPYTDKGKLKKVNILRSCSYTPDYIIEWNWSKCGLLVSLINHITSCKCKDVIFFASTNAIDSDYSYVEVKPLFDQNNMTRLFKTNQKLVYKVHNEFVNLIIPIKLFEATFTPKKYLLSNSGRQYRKIKHKVVTIEEYLKQFSGVQQTLF